MRSQKHISCSALKKLPFNNSISEDTSQGFYSLRDFMLEENILLKWDTRSTVCIEFYSHEDGKIFLFSLSLIEHKVYSDLKPLMPDTKVKRNLISFKVPYRTLNIRI